MASIYELLLFTLSIRFFLIDFKLLKPLRDEASTRWPLLLVWLQCPFCNGFWIGLILALVNYNFNPLPSIAFALTSGFISFLVYLLTQALVKYVNS
ncbi:ABC-type polysaccharide/polyol phosphate export permease [Bacillus horti]|uniref:ABC-type polysaccharide/polyol phosphate export permease n=1 Tax=Caldalkalibacillus horti TaxID=77523 RepID=A0ABT9W177_9BACI|nr:ABC-type polysaccharide/polyol phosphate export permease [Bacillus horti]